MNEEQFDSPIYEQGNPFTTFDNIETKNEVLSKAFYWMFWGLGISAIAALLFSQAVMNNPVLIMALLPLAFIELIFVIVFSSKVATMSVGGARTCFVVYAIINGLTLASIFLSYEISSIYITFLITASMFAVAALYGKITKKDLSSMGTYLMMGLWGLIIAGIINIFLRNSMLDFLSSLIGIVIFIGLTAYDVNKIKKFSVEVGLDSNEQIEKVGIMGALTLYLDFINLFLRLLQFFGKRRN